MIQKNPKGTIQGAFPPALRNTAIYRDCLGLPALQLALLLAAVSGAVPGPNALWHFAEGPVRVD